MNFSVAIYETRNDRGLLWRTVGLGPHDTVVTGRSDVRLQKSLADGLKAVLHALDPAEQHWFAVPQGVRLERVHLELSLGGRGGGGKRQTVTGRFPLVLVPHWVRDGVRRTRYFHPARPQDWAWLHPDHPLADQARALFSARWSGLDPDALEALGTDGKDSIRRVAFSAEPRTLLDGLEDKPGVWDDLDVDPLRRKDHKKGKAKRRGLTVLPTLATDMTAQLLERAVDLGVRRQPYAARMSAQLSGAKKRSTVVIGPPGVGKTTILRRAIADLAVTDGYFVHRNLDQIHHVYRLSGRRIIAGMSHLGDWEERCVAILEEARANPVILWLDDVSDFARLGRTRDADRNLAEFFRGPVARGDITLVAEATAERWQRLEADAPSFAAAFARTVVAPTDAAETLTLLFRAARTHEQRHRVAVEPRAFKAILDLGASLFPDTALPGSALDLLGELVAQGGDPANARVRQHLEAGHKIAAIKAHRQATGMGLAESKAAVEALADGATVVAGKPRYARKITGRDVLALLSDKTGLPTELLQLEQRLDPEDVARTFRRYVIGQEPAVAAARDLFLRIRAGLTAPGRPFAVYLLTGPTGTGKTELAKAIAEGLYGDRARLLRFDMSELSGPDAVARLIGDDFEERGTLTGRVREERFCVLLLDEVEKAHPAVLQLMLQLFDEGRLTDAQGFTADFTHSVVLMTSNLGAETADPLGFGRDPNAVTERMVDAVKEFFPPELFNRIDRIVPFAPLGRDAAMQIARKELRLLLGRRGLVDRRVWATPTRSVVEKVVAEAFTPRDGARPVKRYLEDRVASVLTEHLSGGGAAAMRLLRLFVRDGEIAVHAEALVEAEPTPGRFALTEVEGASREEVIEALRDAARFLRSDGEASARRAIEDAISARLADGDTDTIYELELARQSLEALRDRVDEALANAPTASATQPRRGLGSRPKARGRARLHQRPKAIVKADALALLAETTFLERVLSDGVPSGDRHAVFIELLRLGEGASTVRPLVESQGLIPWLTAAYRRARGDCEDVAARRRGEPLLTLAASAEAALDLLPTERPDHVVMKVVGLHVVDFFEGETGCHVWESVRAGTEVVRVRAFPAPARVTAGDVIESHVEARRAFDRALEAGDATLPDNPESLLPIVRAVRFDPPRGSGGSGGIAPLTIEDYALGDARHAEVHSPLEMLAELMQVRMTRRRGPGQDPSEEDSDG
ncbi:MAG: hypothetical protein DRJ42_07550 [Deltaproteobacteria bacterium]|nr:MAG: hypothetical protein DRJ42_07550 [Deltaproteobacteria bacterium]